MIVCVRDGSSSNCCLDCKFQWEFWDVNIDGLPRTWWPFIVHSSTKQQRSSFAPNQEDAYAESHKFHLGFAGHTPMLRRAYAYMCIGWNRSAAPRLR